MTRPRVLVVEDELLIARDIAMQLDDLGYLPLGPATSGEQAIGMAEAFSPQLVLMDIQLAGAMDGIAAAQTILERFGIRTVFLSAFDGEDSLSLARLARPAGFLSKPFEEGQLRDVMAAAFKSL